MSDSQYYGNPGNHIDLSGDFNGPYMLSTVKWPEWHMAENGCRNVAGVSGDPGNAGYFTFEKRGCSPNEYYLISPQSAQENVYMGSDSEGNVQIKPGDPGTQGHWKIEHSLKTVLIDECGGQVRVIYYKFTPLAYPNWHMFVDSDSTGNVKGKCGDNPGKQGQILFKKIPC